MLVDQRDCAGETRDELPKQEADDIRSRDTLQLPRYTESRLTPVEPGDRVRAQVPVATAE
jgi:hypothetical protein